MNPITIQPPVWSGRFLQWVLPSKLKEPILGDLEEEFLSRAQINPNAAKRWYQQQALRSAFQFLWKTKRGLMMFIFSLVVFGGLTIMALVWGGGIDMFIDIPSAMLVFIPSTVFALAATSSKTLSQGISALLNDESQFDKQTLTNAQLFFKVLGQTAILTGIFSSLIGAIAIGSHFQADDFSTSFGPVFAVCILTLTYGFGVKTICYVAEQKLQFKINQLV
ncbi:hypothetical protein KUL42_07050 [Alteromonas sp. KUL42]|uniref:hypothetical protein n=1 Tax=Alteromonas sp. KUL42 TaxID=2480797 RepID=UPI0010366C72|nr:hypothetical protein [Alteromonas sp. KUL42]TAP37523.1 hypothetical protein EYR97_03485 [Alteromonas sp. KUL42]GEA05944.1 hypothetical protein KUL42_07050 [Alteromonas sp. KUL42]